MTLDSIGVEEKLKRSRENILNLQAEISRFFETSEYPVLPDYDVKALLKAAEYHQSRAIPPRFSVLAGEIVHHLRSCLDHIAWQFSTVKYRTDHETWIGFPILEARPVEKDELKRYERKVGGIVKPEVRSLIDALQPYNSPDALDSGLLILHKMDIVDKHRELNICLSTGGIAYPFEVIQRVIAKHRASYESGIFDAAFEADTRRELQGNAQIKPIISFPHFGSRELEAVEMALMELHNAVVTVVKRFDTLR